MRRNVAAHYVNVSVHKVHVWNILRNECLRFAHLSYVSFAFLRFLRFMFSNNLRFVAAWCCCIMVDPETHTQRNEIWFYKLSLHRKTNIIENTTKKNILITFIFCRRSFVKNIFILRSCWAKQIFPFSDITRSSFVASMLPWKIINLQLQIITWCEKCTFLYRSSSVGVETTWTHNGRPVTTLPQRWSNKYKKMHVIVQPT